GKRSRHLSRPVCSSIDLVTLLQQSGLCQQAMDPATFGSMQQDESDPALMHEVNETLVSSKTQREKRDSHDGSQLRRIQGSNRWRQSSEKSDHRFRRLLW